MMKSQAQVIDLFRELGIYVDDTTSEKFINTCLYADLEVQVRINDKLVTVPCKSIQLKINEAGFLKKVTIQSDDVEYDEMKERLETEKQLKEFNELLGGY